MTCKCGGEYILDGSWYVCQECHEIAGDFPGDEDECECLSLHPDYCTIHAA